MLNKQTFGYLKNLNPFDDSSHKCFWFTKLGSKGEIKNTDPAVFDAKEV
jgi:hypothetical protein